MSKCASDSRGCHGRCCLEKCALGSMFSSPASHPYTPAYRAASISEAPRAWEPAFCPSLHPYLIICIFILFCVCVSNNTVLQILRIWAGKIARLLWYCYTSMRTKVQIPRNYVKIWVLQCTPVIPVLISERGQRQGNPQMRLTRQSK